jgi:hypothetical protein
MLGFRDTGTEAALRLRLADVGAPFTTESAPKELALKDLGENK